MTILNDIKSQLGPTSDDTYFDQELLIHINSVMVILYQLGVMATPVLVDATTEWSVITGDSTQLELVKTYMAMKVKMIFDPPTSGTLADSLNNIIRELEWRIAAAVNPVDTFVSEQEVDNG